MAPSHIKHPKEVDSRGRYIDTRQHEVTRAALDVGLWTDQNQNNGTNATRPPASGYMFRVLVTENDGTTQEMMIDYNDIKTQGIMAPVFRCPMPACHLSFTRREQVRKHIQQSSYHATCPYDWNAHETCRGYPVHEHPNYRGVPSRRHRDFQAREALSVTPPGLQPSQAPGPPVFDQPGGDYGPRIGPPGFVTNAFFDLGTLLFALGPTGVFDPLMQRVRPFSDFYVEKLHFSWSGAIARGCHGEAFEALGNRQNLPQNSASKDAQTELWLSQPEGAPSVRKSVLTMPEFTGVFLGLPVFSATGKAFVSSDFGMDLTRNND